MSVATRYTTSMTSAMGLNSFAITGETLFTKVGCTRVMNVATIGTAASPHMTIY
ncbi:hypothetical protein D3C87_2200600 [compost metagenome]